MNHVDSCAFAQSMKSLEILTDMVWGNPRGPPKTPQLNKRSCANVVEIDHEKYLPIQLYTGWLTNRHPY